MGAPPISFCAMGGTPIQGWPAAEAARAEPECARFRGSQSERSTSRVMSGRSGTAGRCSGGPALPAGGRSIPPGWASTTRGPHRHLGEAAPTGSRLASRAGRAESVPGWWREAEALRSAVRPQPRRQYPGRYASSAYVTYLTCCQAGQRQSSCRHCRRARSISAQTASSTPYSKTAWKSGSLHPIFGATTTWSGPLRGGYPEAARRSDPGRRGRFFESYISDVINRDVRQLTRDPANW